MNAAAAIDAAVAGPLLVFGSLPPEGADIDALVPTGMMEPLAAALGEAGFVGHGEQWARFHSCTVDVAELVPATAWRLPEPELRRLFAEALPIPGFQRLVRPAPPHALLVLARRLVYAGGMLDDKRRARVDAALAEDPSAWASARALAPAWRATGALSALEAAHASGMRMTRPERLRALREERGPRGALAAIGARAQRGGGDGFVVSFSGLDGAGKTTQAEALRDALIALGLDAEVVWTSLIAHGSLGWLARPVKRALLIVGRGRKVEVPAGPDETWSESAPTHKPDHGTMLRRRSSTITFGWTLLACIGIGRWQGRETRPRLRRGKVVICDRYTLDTKVHLRYEYGDRPYRLHMRLVELLSPTPRRAFLLDVPAATAHARKGEYEVHQLERRATLYREEAEALGAVQLDGERPREDLCAEIARSVWLASAARGGTL